MHTPRATGRRVLLAAGALLALALAALIVAMVVRASRGTSTRVDGALRATATRLLPALTARGRLPISDSTLNSYKAWVYDTEFALVRAVQRSVPRDQFVQVQLSDPSTAPPQIQALGEPGRPVVRLDSATVQSVTQSHSPTYTTLQQGGQRLRVYVLAVPTPAALQPAGATGLLEVVAPL
ncbi:MAG TPA: hypothetical protein VKX16_00555 [Chloroflexota bacterium]|nr:hypothetical protein [Chloroflexota bacterium]